MCETLKEIGYIEYPHTKNACVRAFLRKKVIAYVEKGDVFFYSRHKGFKGFLGALQAKWDCMRLRRRLGK